MAKKKPTANEPSSKAAGPREKYPAIPLPNRRRGSRPEIERGGTRRPGWFKRLTVGLTWSVMLVLATGAALRIFLHDRWMPLVWWNAFTLYVYLPAYVCLVIAIVMRQWRLTGLAALVIACHVVWITPDFVPRGLLASTTGGDASAANGAPVGSVYLYYQNLNLHTTDFQRRIEDILEENADVIALVEFVPKWEDAVRESQLLEKYPHHTLRANPRSQQAVLFSKRPLEDVEYRFIAGRRLAVAATILIKDEPLRLFCLHAPRPVWEQAEQYRRFSKDAISWIGDESLPHVVVGDFNATQHSAWYQQLASRANLHSAHRDAGRGYAVTWPNGRNLLPPIRIDHVLLSPELTCLNISEGDGGDSDHKPLSCELSLASNAAAEEDDP